MKTVRTIYDPVSNSVRAFKNQVTVYTFLKKREDWKQAEARAIKTLEEYLADLEKKKVSQKSKETQ